MILKETARRPSGHIRMLVLSILERVSEATLDFHGGMHRVISSVITQMLLKQ